MLHDVLLNFAVTLKFLEDPKSGRHEEYLDYFWPESRSSLSVASGQWHARQCVAEGLYNLRL